MQQFIFHSSFRLSSVHQKALIPLSRHQLGNLRLLHLAMPQVSPFPRLVFSGTLVLSLFDLSGRSLRYDLITACKCLPGEKTAGY